MRDILVVSRDIKGGSTLDEPAEESTGEGGIRLPRLQDGTVNVLHADITSGSLVALMSGRCSNADCGLVFGGHVILILTDEVVVEMTLADILRLVLVLRGVNVPSTALLFLRVDRLVSWTINDGILLEEADKSTRGGTIRPLEGNTKVKLVDAAVNDWSMISTTIPSTSRVGSNPKTGWVGSTVLL